MHEEALIKNIVEQIIMALPPNSIICIALIGSYSRGTFESDSDIDLIVVSDCYSSINGYIRNKMISSEILSKVKIDLLCLTVREYGQYMNSKAYQRETIEIVYKGELYETRFSRIY